VTKLSVRCLTTEERLEQTPDTTLTDLLLREEEKHESASFFWFQVWEKSCNGLYFNHIIIVLKTL
jgi:hypothetical protein